MTEIAHSLAPERAFAGIEHRDLAPGLARVRSLAARVGRRAAPELAHDLHAVVRWFADVVEPHMAWEEAWLYPELDRLAGTTWATRVPRFEHGILTDMVSRLDRDGTLVVHQPTPEQAAELAAHLIALEALLRAHIEVEERILLPLLDEPVTPVR
jgi:iron-sulfur cluster repair protein YtfE (RIC family)